jgi:hypothetical protein
MVAERPYTVIPCRPTDEAEVLALWAAQARPLQVCDYCGIKALPNAPDWQTNNKGCLCPACKHIA